MHLIPNLAPDEYRCSICWQITHPSEIDWDAFEETGSMFCISCSPELDEELED